MKLLLPWTLRRPSSCFRNLPIYDNRQNVKSNSMFLSLGAFKKFTLRAFRYYCSGSITPDFLYFLELSVGNFSLKLTQQCHARILHYGFIQNSVLATKLISVYAACGGLPQSHRLFNSIHVNNVYLWNTLINAYVKNYSYDNALQLFREMCQGPVLPDNYTLATLSKVSGELGDLISGEMIHGKSIRMGSISDIIVANSLMSTYLKCGQLSQLQKLFDEMPKKNVGSWNVLLASCVNCKYHASSSDWWTILRNMQGEGLKLDGFTVASVLPLCVGNREKWDYGRELHCYIVKNAVNLDICSDVHLGSSLIDMYSRSNNVVLARRVFDQLKFRNVYVWTAVINNYVENEEPDAALTLFRDMQWKDGIQSNEVSLISVLPACSSLSSLIGGKQVHGFAIRTLAKLYVALGNALIDMYAKCGSLEYAIRVFEDVSFVKDSISWSSIISAYGLHGRGKEAISTFYKMLQFGNKPDKITVVSVLSACTKSNLVQDGLNIYTLVTDRYGMKPTTEICACVVDMLSRSGQLDRALKFIQTMPLEPVPSIWGALLSGSVMHGNSKMRDLAQKCLLQMEPDNPSNYISLSNLYASSRKWNVVAEIRSMMKERGLKKAPGCSWIMINGNTHCFFVSDKAHPCSNLIYEMLSSLVRMMKETDFSSDDSLTFGHNSLLNV